MGEPGNLRGPTSRADDRYRCHRPVAPANASANAPVPAIRDTLGPLFWDARYGTVTPTRVPDVGCLVGYREFAGKTPSMALYETALDGMTSDRATYAGSED